MPEAGELLQGKIIGGKFHLGAYLGGSDRSAVFRTEILSNGRRSAAIKLIPADPRTADLQLSRWKLISRLTHPHLLQLLEAGRCREDGADLLYVVMEYAEENLAQVLLERPLTADETNEMLKPVLEALAYLHGRDFVHGHLKPANIMVAGDQLKLASDCICRVGEMDVADTGTYAPPDPPGRGATPDRDIWSLGVTVVQVLTQLLPVRNGQGVTLPETLPAQFAELAENCLEPDPQGRCTLAEIAEHLHYKLPARTLGPPSLPPEPIGAEQPTPPNEAQEATKKRFAVPIAAIIFTVLAFVAGWNLFKSRPPQPELSATALQEPALPQTSQAAGSGLSSAQRPSGQDKLPGPAPRTTQPGERATLKNASETAGVAPTPTLAPRESLPPGVLVSGEILQQVLPEVSRAASNTIRGTVRVTVRVRVDPAGNVAGVSMVSAGPSRYFARLAAEAAQQWKFSPAHRDGQNTASAWTIRFEFIRGGVRAIPVTSTP